MAMIKIKARQDYICDKCHRVIHKGEEYRKSWRWIGWEKDRRQERLCSSC